MKIISVGLTISRNEYFALPDYSRSGTACAEVLIAFYGASSMPKQYKLDPRTAAVLGDVIKSISSIARPIDDWA